MLKTFVHQKSIRNAAIGSLVVFLIVHLASLLFMQNRGLAAFYGIVFILSELMFLRWIFYSYYNLTLIEPGFARMSPGWATACLIIPYLSFIQGHKVLRDLHWGSLPDDRPSVLTTPVPIKLWLAGIVVSVLGAASQRFFNDSAALVSVGIVVSALYIPIKIYLVLYIGDMQMVKYNRKVSLPDIDQNSYAVSYKPSAVPVLTIALVANAAFVMLISSISIQHTLRSQSQTRAALEAHSTFEQQQAEEKVRESQARLEKTNQEVERLTNLYKNAKTFEDHQQLASQLRIAEAARAAAAAAANKARFERCQKKSNDPLCGSTKGE